MAMLFAKRLTYWLMGTPDDSPPPVPIPPQITPLLDHVAVFLNLRGHLSPDMTREEIMDTVNSAITDRELQAHVMAYLRDYHGMTFDPKHNPDAPAPQYYSSAGRRLQSAKMVITGKPAEAEVFTPYAIKPYFTSVPVGFDMPIDALEMPTKIMTAAPGAETVTAGSEKGAIMVTAAQGKQAQPAGTAKAKGEKEGTATAEEEHEAHAKKTVATGGEEEAPGVGATPALAHEKTTEEEKRWDVTTTGS